MCSMQWIGEENAARMTGWMARLGGLLLLIWLPVLRATPVPALQGRVNDYAHVLGDRAAAIEAKLAAQERSTGNQVVVLTVPDLGGGDIESYSNEVFHAWKLGRKDVDDGVLIVLAVQDRRARIEVGYGLEGTLTDLASSRILRDVMHPHFATGDYAGGMEAGVDAVLSVLAGEELAPPVRSASRPPWWMLLFPMLFVGVFSLIASVGRGRRLLWLPLFFSPFLAIFVAWPVALLILLGFYAGIYALRLRWMRREFLRRTANGRLPTNSTVKTWPPRFGEVWLWPGSGQGRHLQRSSDGTVTFSDSGGGGSDSSSDFSGGGGDSGGGGSSDSW